MCTVNNFEHYKYLFPGGKVFTVYWHVSKGQFQILTVDSKPLQSHTAMKVSRLQTGIAKQGWPLCHVMHVTVPFRTRRLFISSLQPPLSLLAATLCIFEISIKINFQLRHYRWRQVVKILAWLCQRRDGSKHYNS